MAEHKGTDDQAVEDTVVESDGAPREKAYRVERRQSRRPLVPPPVAGAAAALARRTQLDELRGAEVGAEVGALVGAFVGASVGAFVGTFVGTFVYWAKFIFL